MKRKLFFLMTLGIMVVGGLFVPSHTTAQTAPIVKIGVLTPKTGSLGALGQSFENGAKLAIKDMNSKQSDYTFQADVKDTETSSSGAQAAATALVGDSVVGVVGAAASSSTLAAINPLKEAKIPLVSYASTSPALTTNQDNGYLFRVVPSDALQGQAAAALADHLGVKSVAIINIDDAYGQGLAGAFKSAFTDNGGNVKAEVSYNQETTTDFSTQVTTLVDAGADAVYMVSFISDGQQVIAQLNQQGFKGQIIGSDGIASDSLINATAVSDINTYAKGVVGTAPTVSGSAAFVSAYNAEYGNDPGIFVAESYDAAHLIAESYITAATANGGSATGADVQAQLATTKDYQGVSGTFSFDSNGDRTTANYDIWQFQPTPSDSSKVHLVVVGSYTSAGGLSDTLQISSYANGGLLPVPFASFLAGFAVLAVAATAYRRRKY